MKYRRGIIIGLLSTLFFAESIMLSINYNQQQVKPFSVSQQIAETSETYENGFEAIIPVEIDNSTTPIEMKGSKDVNENNDSLLWMKVSAIGTLLSSMATTCAVIVALWQTRFSQKKKLKLSFTDDVCVIPDNMRKTMKYVGIEIVNIGNRCVTIKSWGFILDDGSRVLIIPDHSLIYQKLFTSLPKKIEIEESISLMYERNLFVQSLNDCVKAGQLKETNKLIFYAFDSTGKEYTVRSNKAIACYIDNTKK